ncbi:anthranilate phosphoribosyltransferase [Geotalea daltonii FRC-32]|uniref:Anthranilate phosphoribosyltransferase n=1 Tax=Geotalea daltonii (strain DSM 22248 / JCM 15807 / FRC-32) TaxID=316067 RepID=TRPD_GEODF|nr:anthranilate phosphoribosyltransferase [Geotalea daltonii]B9M5M2.1 RecName: Full=Anthranilate phosphoribosyltransferase [Geotalea daltonii FRC-32]ACM21781.1 anthranilate phosphoribosyltransferase [Geotalea daltonii FRC-32]
MIKKAIARVVEREDLSQSEMIQVMDQIMSGEATPAQIAAFITALRMKGETVAEIAGAARVMRDRATRIRVGKNVLDLDRDDINIDLETILDVVGTGGDGTNTFNISTTVSFVVAACGVKVAKHGNRSVSSACGSADVVEALGISLEVTPETVENCINEAGIGFLYAPALHGAMKFAIGPRKEIGIRTIFNILGPLTNPAGAPCQVLGVYREELVEKLAHVLKNLGCRRGFVVYGMDGMDEITLTTETRMAEVTPEEVKAWLFKPEDLGFARCTMDDLRGGDAVANAVTVRGILEGEKGPKRDVVLINAAFGLVAAGRAANPAEGVKLAVEALDSGAALAKLEKLKALTNA